MIPLGAGQDPWLTVVTVVKDDPTGFLRTARSVTHQMTSGVEWMVIDSSSDASQIMTVIDAFRHPGAAYHWTPPQGVYTAMNEGLARASGEFIHFLNAGDEYAAVNSIADIAEVVRYRHVFWTYGNVSFVSESGQEVVPPAFDYANEKAAGFSRGRFPPHQGTVVRTRALRDIGGFDLSYQIVADYAAFLRLSLLYDPVEMDNVIARFHEGGLSSTKWRQSLREFHQARVTILQPTGGTAVRERWETLRQSMRMAGFRIARRTGFSK